MKRLKLFNLLLLAAMAWGSVACSNDDDPSEGMGGGAGEGVCSVEGRSISYNRGYFYREPYGPEPSIELIFSDYDVKTLPDKIVNALFMTVTTNENTLPAGTFSYSNSDEELNAWSYVEAYDFNPGRDIDGGDGLPNTTYLYVSDWNPGYESGNMTVTRNGNFYRIEINDMKLVKDTNVNEDDGVTPDDPKTTATFVWEGELEDITDWMNEEEYSRSFSQRMSFARSMHVVK